MSYDKGDLQVSDLDFDSFGTPVSESTRILIDQPATIPTNRERHRYYVDTGTGYDRVNNPIEDNTNSFEDQTNFFLVKCPAGERREFRTAKRATYQSGYETEWGIAWRAVQNLSDGQKVRVRLVDTPREDAVVAEYRNVNGEIEGEFYLQNASGKLNSTGKESFNPQPDLTTPRICRGFSSFYAVGKHRLEEIITEEFRTTNPDDSNVRQSNQTVAEIADVDDWSVESFNFHLGIEVDCRDSSSGLDVEIGTHVYKVRADTPETRRQKEFRNVGLTYDGSNANYEPVLAARVDPSRDNVPLEIPGTEIEGGDPGEVVAVACFPDEVTFTGNDSWSSPVQASENDSVIQSRTDVDQILDNNDTFSSDVDQVNNNMRTVSMSATAGRKSIGSSSAETIISPLHPDEVMVYLLKADSATNVDYNIRTLTEENW